MGILLAVIQFALVPVLLAVAVAIRSAGQTKPLNVVDYARVADPAALHRWAGNRLLLLPAAFLASGMASWQFPALALLFLGGATLACLCVAVWIALGAESFTRA